MAIRSFKSFIKLITPSKEVASPFYKKSFKYSLIVLITTVNYLLTYVHAFDWSHLYYFLSDLFVVFVIIEFYLICINILDKYLPWNGDVKKRLLIQLTVVSLIMAVFNIILNELVEAIDSSGRIDIRFYSFDTVVALVLIITVQFIYVALHFIYDKPNTLSSIESTERFKVNHGTTSKILRESEILGAFVQNNITYLLESQCIKYISDEPLKDIDARLSNKFFRANRQTIITGDLVAGYKSLDYGKIEVELNCTNISNPITISRKNASAFRKWFKTNP